MAETNNAGLVLPLDVDNTRLSQRMAASVKLVDDGCGNMVTKAQAAAARIDASFGKVTLDGFKRSLTETAALQDKLVAARVAGDKITAASLAAELDVRQKVQKAQVAQLETQLAIANATGSKKQSAELQEVLALTQRLNNLRGAGITGSRGLGQATQVGAALAGAEAPSISRAATSFFDSTRLATLEAGGARLRLFGSALEPLGAYGLAAAAGVVALGVALAQTHEAIEYADGLYRAAAAAHTTTDELQKLQAVLAATGGDRSGAAPALAAFNEQLGRAETGIPRALKAFQELFGTGFNAADAKALGARGDALNEVVARIQNLKSPEQQDAAIQQFGLEGLKTPILAGAEAWKRYQDEAKAAGLILDAGVIQRGHELATQIDDLSLKIKNELTTAFVDLGPILVGLLGILDKMAEAAERVGKGIQFGHDLPTKIVQGARPLIQNIGQSNPELADILGKIFDAAGNAASLGQTSGGHSSTLPSGVPPSGDLNDLSASNIKKESADLALEAEKAALARAQEELQARLALTQNVQRRADLENQLASNALAQRAVDLKKRVSDAIFDEAQGKITKAALDQVQSEAQLALLSAQKVAALTKSLRDRQAQWAQEDQDAETEKRERDATIADLKLRRAAPGTLDVQNALDRQILALQQKQALEDFGRSQARQVQTKEITPQVATQRHNAFLDEQSDASAALDRTQVGGFLSDAEAKRQQNVAAQSAELERSQAHAEALGNLANTLADRTKFERQALDDAQKREQLLADAEVDRANAEKAAAIASGSPEALTAADAHIASATAARNALPGQLSDQNAAFDRSHENPIDAYTHSIQDLNTAVQEDAVNGFKDLTSGLVDAALHAKNAGDVIRNVFLNLAQQILTQVLQKQAASGFSSLLGAIGLGGGGGGGGAAGAADLADFAGLFADGGQVSGPGTSRSDSILAMLSDGEYVINASATKAHRPLLDAINSGRLGRYADGGLVAPSFPSLRGLSAMATPRAASAQLYAPIYNDLRGAIVQEDLYDHINRSSAAAAAQGAQRGRALAVQDIQRAGYLANVNQ